MTDGRLTIQQVQRFELNPDFAKDILSALEEKTSLTWEEYKCIRHKHRGITRGDLLALVLRNKLAWQQGPFRLSTQFNKNDI
jgi:hypothetical protein